MGIGTKKIKTTVNEINAKRINDIFAYLISLNSPICNPNCREIAKANPIMVVSAYNELVDIQKEIEQLKIDIESIDVERIFRRDYANETERFIAGLREGRTFAYAQQDYKRMIELEALDAIYPYEDRVRRKNELEQEIERKKNAQLRLARVAPQLVKNEDQTIKQLQSELDSLVETLDIPTREEIRLHLYTDAMNYIDHLRKMIFSKLSYIAELIKKI